MANLRRIPICPERRRRQVIRWTPAWIAGACLLLLASLAGCRSTSPLPEDTPAGAVQGSWVLEVEREGPYWLGPAWFESRGMDPAVALAEVRLGQGGKSVPYLAVEAPEGPGLFFYATVAPSRYAPWSAYRLEVGERAAGPAMAAAEPSRATTSTVQDTAWTSAWFEEDEHYLPQVRAPVPWFWESVLSGDSITRTATLTDAVPGPITVTVRLWGQGSVSAGNPAPRLWWGDGQLLGTWQWDGPAEQSWPASLAAPDRPQTLVLELPDAEDGTIARAWLDGWGVSYRRPLSPESGGLTWLAEGGAAAIAAAADTRLLDVSDPEAPVDLGMLAGQQVSTQSGRRYWAGIPWLAPEPVRTRPLTAVEWAELKQADYLIIAPEPFWEALAPLEDHRRDQGRTVVHTTPQQVYDAFGDGRPGPEAIRAMVQHLQDQGKLHYLLLVGDGSTRPGGYTGPAGVLRVVTALVPTAHLHETPSDQALVTDSEGRPLVAVGRLPAQTADQVEAVVDKTLRWEERGAASGLILVDDSEDFARFADEIGAFMPIPWQRVDAAEEGARALTLETLGGGETWLNYVGHGSLALWGDEKILQREDEWDRPAVVTVWACLSAYFIHHQQDSLAEVWLHSARGGAVAFVGPTGETYLTQQQPIALALYQAIAADESLGDSLLAGWLAAGDREQDAARSFLLLGDPALRLYPPGRER